jgi:methionyl aminopeptidase
VISLKTTADIEAISKAGAILAALFDAIVPEVRPGVSTADLDLFGENFIMSHAGATPSFKGLYGFPASLCISINHEVVHGIPSEKRIVQEGDIVKLDGGVQLDGWYADSARTYAVGDIDAVSEILMRVTAEALQAGIAQAQAGNRLGDIGSAIQNVAETAGFTVVRDLVGHGIGREPHEEPQVPNFGKAGKGMVLQPGLVLAIEPMVNAGTPGVRTLSDRWTVVTLDKQRSAHFEHTVAVTENGPKVLTSVV